MLALEDIPYSNSACWRLMVRAVAYCQSRQACRIRLDELTSVNELLARINGDQGGSCKQVPSRATLESLRRVTARVGRQLTIPVDWTCASTRTARRFAAALRSLILAYTTTQSLLDEDDLKGLGWTVQRGLLEHLRAGLVVRNGDSVDASIECGVLRALRQRTAQV